MKIKSVNLALILIVTASFAAGCATYGGGQQAPPIPTTKTGEDGVIIAVTPVLLALVAKEPK